MRSANENCAEWPRPSASGLLRIPTPMRVIVARGAANTVGNSSSGSAVVALETRQARRATVNPIRQVGDPCLEGFQPLRKALDESSEVVQPCLPVKWSLGFADGALIIHYSQSLLIPSDIGVLREVVGGDNLDRNQLRSDVGRRLRCKRGEQLAASFHRAAKSAAAILDSLDNPVLLAATLHGWSLSRACSRAFVALF